LVEASAAVTTIQDYELLAAQVAQLETQLSYQTNALRAALEARWSGGADTVDGWVKALDPDLQTAPRTPYYA
jgi:hypothetical protein